MTLEPKNNVGENNGGTQYLPKRGHSISLISCATLLNKFSSFNFSFLSVIAFFSFNANSAFGSGSKFSWLSSTAPTTSIWCLSGSGKISIEARGWGLKSTKVVSASCRGDKGKCDRDVSGRSTSHRSGPTTADPSSFPAIPPSDEKNEIENEAIDDNVDLQEVISKGSLDFDKWTLLISEIEKGVSLIPVTENGMVLMLLVRPLSSTRSSLERSLLQFLLLGSMLRLEYKNTSVTVWDVGGQDKQPCLSFV
ncbi:hypothetical protein HKD37_15G043275 [Glycine soja]